MKNVRLFAVAAALGMFASTVAAAETTKTTVKWDNKADIIRVDEGQYVVLPTPTAQVVVDDKKAGCQNGVDANGDELVDLPVYGIDTKSPQFGNFNDSLWYSQEVAVEDVTLGGLLTLGPNESTLGEDSISIVNLATYETYGSYEEAFEAAEKAKLIEVARESDGSIASVTYTKIAYNNDTKKAWATGQVSNVVTANSGRKSDENIMEYVVKLLAGTVSGADAALVKTDDSYETPYVSNVDADSNLAAVNANKASITFDFAGNGTQVDIVSNYNVLSAVSINSNAPIVFVAQSRRGEYSFVQLDDVITPNASNVADVYKSLKVLAGTSSKTKSEVTKGTLAHVVGDVTAASYAFVDTANSNKLTYKTGSWLSANFTADTFWAENAKTLKDVKANTEYVLENGTTFINGSDVDFAYVSSTTTAYDKNHDEATDAFDSIAVTSVDKWGTASTKIIDAKTADITFVRTGNGKLEQVTSRNFDQYLNDTTLALGTLFIDGVQYNQTGLTTLVDHSSTVADGVKVFKPLVTKTVAYDYVIAGDGYNKCDKNYGGAVAILKLATGNVVGALTDPIFNASTVVNPAYDALKALGKSGYVTVVDVTNITEEVTLDPSDTPIAYTLEDYSVVSQFEIPSFKTGELLTDFELVITEDNDFELQPVAKNVTDWASTVGHIPEIDANDPFLDATLLVGDIENDTQLYVYLDTTSFTYSSSKGTGTITTWDGQKISCKIVDLGTRRASKYYPAFDTEEELNEAIAKIFGIKELEGTAKDSTTSYGKWYAANGGVDNNGDPLRSSATYVGEESVKCSYEVASAATVDRDLNGLALDGTAKAGVYDVKYTASVDGKAVGEVGVTKVVVAPKYYREYQNGKVVKCTSYYADGSAKVYSVTEYDWTKKVATVTYFDLNGAPAGTQEIKLG